PPMQNPPKVDIHPERIDDDILPAHRVDLADVISSSDPRIDVKASIIGRYSEDPFFKLIIDVPTSYKNFEYRGGLVYVKDKERRALCIPDVKIGDRRAREIIISQAHSILAHLGPRKTIVYLRDNVWWK
ncbi:hypothetical protein FIBSPDRAFT_687948, partial [Athelia psychrophila]